MASFTQRMLGAALLDARTYEEVEADRTATSQAMGVVVLSSLATGIGLAGSVGVADVLAGTLASLLGWFVWAFLTYLVGTRLLPEPQTQADVGELLRTTGFSAAPGLLRVVGFVPLLGWIVFLATSVWMLASFVVAVRQALDYRGTGRAVVVCLIGWLVWIAFSIVVVFARRVVGL